jgi:truncated hemoglobin YjbI
MTRSKFSVCLSVLVVALAACGGDDGGEDGAGDSSSGGSASTTATTTASTTATTTASTTESTTATTDASSTTDDPTTDTGADSSTGAATCMTDVCSTYGAAVPVVAGAIVDQAAADPEFADFFAPLVGEGTEAIDAFKASLANFITDAYGCTTGAYTGPSMPEAHAGMGITQQQYDDFIALIVGVLQGAGVPEDDINYCFAPPLVDPAFEAMIIGQ